MVATASGGWVSKGLSPIYMTCTGSWTVANDYAIGKFWVCYRNKWKRALWSLDGRCSSIVEEGTADVGWRLGAVRWPRAAGGPPWLGAWHTLGYRGRYKDFGARLRSRVCLGRRRWLGCGGYKGPFGRLPSKSMWETEDICQCERDKLLRTFGIELLTPRDHYFTGLPTNILAHKDFVL